MYKLISLTLFYWFWLISTCAISAQELKAEVIINTKQVNQTNQKIFKTLQGALQDFINNKHWTNQDVNINERIDCNFIITVNNYESGNFETDLQIQASRPVYNSTYTTSILNYKDNSANFSYQEFEPLVYNPEHFNSNLTSLIVFYINIILGLDADSFSNNGGHPYFLEAQKIVTLAQNSNYHANWTQNTVRGRWQLAENLVSSNFNNFHKAFYDYHRLGLDIMSDDTKNGKLKIAQAVTEMKDMEKISVSSNLIQIFFDTKKDEITEIFSDGSTIDQHDIRELLTL